VAKHAHASQVRVSLDEDDGWIVLTIGDDGVGGADPSQGVRTLRKIAAQRPSSSMLC
jgi:signal transduction histidine kinase